MNTPGFGIKVLSPSGTGPQGGPEQVIFTTKYPFAKIDTQNPVSFQNIGIFFNNDPPFDPTGSTTITTPIYQFKHGYDYIPTYWMLYQNTNASNNQRQWTYGNEGSLIYAPTAFNYAQLLVAVDKLFFTVYVLKSYSGLGLQANIVGFTIKLRVYIFTEPVVIS